MTDVICPPVGFVETGETACGRRACGFTDEIGWSGMVVLPVAGAGCGAEGLSAAGAGVLAPASLLSLRLKIMVGSPEAPQGSRNTAGAATACGHRPSRRARRSRCC